jgi:hypothetical protein
MVDVLLLLVRRASEIKLKNFAAKSNRVKGAWAKKRRSAVCARGEVEVGDLERLYGPVVPRP